MKKFVIPVYYEIKAQDSESAWTTLTNSLQPTVLGVGEYLATGEAEELKPGEKSNIAI